VTVTVTVTVARRLRVLRGGLNRPRARAVMAAGAILFTTLIPVPAAAQLPDWSLEARQRLIGGPNSGPNSGPNGGRTLELAQRAVLLEEGEALLAAGDALAAELAFDRAALLLHAPDTESSLVRSYMQAGDYRRALAFGAHAAGAHREMPAASALYVWLLQVGGQGKVAAQRLDDALAAAPGHRALESARASLAGPWPVPGEALMSAPVRLAPYASADLPPAGSAVVASGVLIAGGHEALVPAAAIGGATTVWLRNGMGQGSMAEPMQRLDDRGLGPGLGVIRLRLQKPLPWPDGQHVALREPFAGSPGSTVEFAATASAQPAWPLLRQGFMGRHLSDGSARLLGIELPAGPRGGPVFDQGGALAGIALAGPDGRARLLGVTTLQPALGPVFGTPAPGTPAGALPPAMALDQVYENALRLTLQVIVAPLPR